jgi:hypothetical protein
MDKFITNGIVILLAQDENEIWFLVYNHLNSLKLEINKSNNRSENRWFFHENHRFFKTFEITRTIGSKNQNRWSFDSEVFFSQKRTGADGSLVLNS